MMGVRICAVGDIMLGERLPLYNHGVLSITKNKGSNYLFENIQNLFQDHDIVIGNLEAPISDYSDKTGLKANIFRADPCIIEGLRKSNFNVLSVANNHIMQHGPKAFWSTVNLLKNNNILPIGIANEIIEIKGFKIGFMAYSFIEDFIDRPPYNKMVAQEDILRYIGNFSDHVDSVILSLHWGDEFITRPSPIQIEFAHQAIDSGANILLGHHSHVLQGIERYHNSLIAYSLGNFIFNMWQDKMRESIILSFELSENGIKDMTIIPVYINNEYRPEIAHGVIENNILSNIKNLSFRLQYPTANPDIEALAYRSEVYDLRRKYRKELRNHFIKNFYKYSYKFVEELITDYIRNKFLNKNLNMR